MLISIITVCLNSESSIEATIKSVLNQTYDNLEYIIWDGGSIDSTPSIIENYAKKNKKIKFKKNAIDSGPGDAFNKSLEITTGNVIGFLAADDIFYNKDVLLNISKKFRENKNIDAVYGNIIYQNAKGLISRRWITGKYKKNSLIDGWSIPFPAFYFKRKCYLLYGGLDTKFDIADDFDLILRYVHVNQIHISYINQIIVVFADSGRSSKIRSRFKAIKEIFLSFKKYKININYFKYILLRYVLKIKQLLR